jgi:hypothetical protein
VGYSHSHHFTTVANDIVRLVGEHLSSLDVFGCKDKKKKLMMQILSLKSLVE